MPIKFWSTLFIFLLGVGFLTLAATRLAPVNALRGEYELENVDPFENSEEAAELQIPTVALSAFRSLAIDYLWIRADEMQMNGQYFDSLHLARMICKLQPHLPSVWENQAWNMAYNISVAMPSPEERWEWVQAGYELMRDDALKFNPESLKVHHYLAWIFQHKIGGITDDHHRYYKRMMAKELLPYLTPIYSRVFMDGYEGVGMMAQAPDDWALVIADPAVVAIVEQIKQLEPQFTTDQEMFDGLFEVRHNPNKYSKELRALFRENYSNLAFLKIDWYIRAQAIKRDWNLDPRLMHAINLAYGPVDFDDKKKRYSLDWRTPYTHAIYWAWHGLQFAKKDERSFNTLRLQRVVYHSLQDLYHYGNLQVLPMEIHATDRLEGQEVLDAPDEIKSMVFNSQDLRMFPIAYQATMDLLSSYTENGEKIPGGVGHGSANLCRSGLVSLYLAGHVDKAQKYFSELGQIAPGNKDYKQPLEDFVAMEMLEEIQNISPKNAANYILDFLRRSYSRYAVGDDDNAQLYITYAEQVHEEFQKQFPDKEDLINRTSLRPFLQMQQIALIDFVNDKMINPIIIGQFMGRLKNERPEVYNWVITELKKNAKKSQDASESGE